MAAMPPDLRQRLERLLLSHPRWEREVERRALLGALRDREIWDDLELEGSAATAAVRFLDLYERHGPEPFRVAVSELRDGRTDPQYLEETAALETALRRREARRRRVRWNDAPYRGLAYFDRRHAPIFFGREAEVEQLIATLTTTEQGGRFTVVVGSSGSGKSSLVRAGLWARLADGQVAELPGSECWLISAMTPLELGDPAASLRASLVRAMQEQDGFEDKRELAARAGEGSLAELAERLLPPGDARWLLILDQMEELFAPEQKQAGAEFLDRLLESARSSRFQVVATLRADFFHHCLDHPPLKRAVGRDGGQFLLGAPGRLALERMVSGPITEVDLPQRWTIDPDLPPAIAADAEHHPGGLALMAFAVRELYERCKAQRRMNVETYRGEAFGGLSGAIARRADDTLADLGEGGAAALERVFARLVRVNQDDAPMRRRERRSAWDRDPEARKLVDAFENARLLVADRDRAAVEDPVIEVAHEALLREWPRLAGWIELRREAFRLAERVRTEAHAWMKGDPSRHFRRPWTTEVIEDARARLAEAGSLHHLQDDPHSARLLTPEVDWILGELRFDATTHTRRRDIGQRLTEIGDPRRGVGVIDGVPDILWRAIPGGEVAIEGGGGHVTVTTFHISAFPVTFGQFRAFLEAEDGHENEHWWKDLKREAHEQIWQTLLVNHPVTHVSWYDATAFCRWLSASFRYEVRLPDQREWQWAAQSARADFAYPWGPRWREGVANTTESDLNRTTAVGTYPQGDSLQEVSDLAGNVWEWCRNQYTPGGESRVLRGGSWDDYRGFARAVARHHYHPDYRFNNIGFRVVCSSPIAGH